MKHSSVSRKWLAVAFSVATVLTARIASADDTGIASPQGDVPANAAPKRVGPFANTLVAGATNKVFRFTGTLTTPGGAKPKYRFCWATPAGAPGPFNCSQWIADGAMPPGGYPITGGAFDTGRWNLVVPAAVGCPATVWLELFSKDAGISATGTFSHTCGEAAGTAATIFSVSLGGPSKRIDLSTAGNSNGTPVQFRVVSNSAVNNCDVAADIFTSGVVQAGSAAAPAPICPALDSGNLALAGFPGTPGVPVNLQKQFTQNAIPPFPNLTTCVAGFVRITAVGADPLGQWDLCVGDGTPAGWVKVIGQTVTGFDSTGTPIFTFVPGMTTIGGVTISGFDKYKKPVPALSMGGAVVLGAVMILFAGFLLRRNRRGLTGI